MLSEAVADLGSPRGISRTPSFSSLNATFTSSAVCWFSDGFTHPHWVTFRRLR